MWGKGPACARPSPARCAAHAQGSGKGALAQSGNLASTTGPPARTITARGSGAAVVSTNVALSDAGAAYAANQDSDLTATGGSISTDNVAVSEGGSSASASAGNSGPVLAADRSAVRLVNAARAAGGTALASNDASVSAERGSVVNSVNVAAQVGNGTASAGIGGTVYSFQDSYAQIDNTALALG